MNDEVIDNNLKNLHLRLEQHLKEQSNNWKSLIYAKQKGFYQGFEKIKIDGWRPSEKRYKQYNIEKYLSKNMNVLDIGCNSGFFSLVVSRFVKQIDGLDINPYLIKIANDVKDYLKIKNSNFYNSSFEEYPENKYDVIFSLANDSTIDGNTKFNFSEYISKIYNMLNKNGILIFESQAEDVIAIESKFNQKYDFMKKYFSVIEKKMVPSEYPVNIPERIFLVLKQKN